MRRRLLPLSFVLAAGAAAQTGPPVRPDTVELDPVTVTALRYPMGLLSAPLGISVVGQDVLGAVKGASLDEALVGVPGVLAQNRAGWSDIRLTVRGYGARGAGDRSNAGTSRGLRVLADGFPETEPDGRTAFDLVDLDATAEIAVVRTNASTLWGNAAGGVVAVSTRPVFERTFVEARGALGGFGFRKAALTAGARLGGGAIWGAASRMLADGWRDHSGGERSYVNVGVAQPLGAATNLRAVLTAARNAYNIPGPLTLAQFEADPRQANPTYAARRERRDNRLARLGVGLDHRVGGTEVSGSVYLNPKYLQRSERGTYRDFTRQHVGAALTARRAVALGGGLRGSLLVGADGQYQDGAILFYGLTADGNRATDVRDNKGEGARSGGAFLQADAAGERLTVSVGARFDDVTYDYRSYITPALNDEKSFRHVTPKVGASWRYGRQAAVYAALGGGVEVPAGNETDPIGTYGQDTVTVLNPLLKPIRSTTFELGTKGAWAPSGAVGALRYDVAAFAIDVRDDLIPYRGGRFYFTAGRTFRPGLEAALDADLGRAVSLGGTVTAMDARYREYAVDSVHYGRPNRIADYKDNEVAGIARLSWSARAKLAPPVARGAFAAVTAQGVGPYYVDDANSVRVPGYGLLGLTVGTDRPVVLGPGLTVRGFVSVANLLDRTYAGSAYVNPDVVSGQPVYLEAGLPRTVTVSLAFGLQR